MMRAIEVALADESQVPAGDRWLSARECAVLEKLTIAKRRRDWRLGRWTGKQAAARIFREGSLEIIAAPDGAPELYVDGERSYHSISISHSNGLALAAVSRVPMAMGCDLEYVEPRSREFINSYFNVPEAALVLRASEDEKHLLANVIWSAKESVLKAMRVGMRRDVRDVHIELQPGETWQEFIGHADGKRWRGVWRAQQGWVHTIAAGPL